MISSTYLKLGAAAIIVAVAGWQWSQIVKGREALTNERAAHALTKQRHAETLQRQATVIAGLAQDAARVQRALQTAESAEDTRYTRELQDVRAENQRLRNNPATRVRIVAAVCPAAPDPGRGDVPGVPAASSVEPAAPEVTGAQREGVLDYDRAVSEDIKALGYLQGYAQRCAAASASAARAEPPQ